MDNANLILKIKDRKVNGIKFFELNLIFKELIFKNSDIARIERIKIREKYIWKVFILRIAIDWFIKLKVNTPKIIFADKFHG